MNVAATPPLDAALQALFERRSASRVTVPIIQPADPYLDTAGEAFRRRIFLTRGEGGQTLCLRPDFTIPVCLSHIAETGRALPRRYSYLGLVFRQRREGNAEFRQAGIEDLGDTELAMADARSLADALASLSACGVNDGYTCVLGDQGLFEAFLAALGLPDGWQRRLIRTFGNDALLASALDDLARHDGHSLTGLDPELHALATAHETGELTRRIRAAMEDDGLSVHAGRSPGEIASRLVEKVRTAEASLSDTSLQLLRRFLAIDCPLSQAAQTLAGLAAEAGLDLGRGLSFFEARNLALQAADVDLDAIRYSAAFGRQIGYYTGMVFEMRAMAQDEPLVGGGRYDRLMNLLGAKEAIPAVGFTLWLDRIEALTGASPGVSR